MEETAYRGMDRQVEPSHMLRSTTPPEQGRSSRRRSLASKITLIFLGGVIFAYSIGALVGWYMFVAAASEQWLNQARVNSQIASATLRSIYTYVSVTADADGQVNGILTDKPIGDDESILVTGFNPSDVLALIGAQTKNAVWLFRYDDADSGFRQIAAAFDNATDDDEKPLATDPIFARDAVAARFATGFATIGDSSHYIGLLPIISTETKKPIGAVAVSIGGSDALYGAQRKLIYNSLIALIVVLTVTGVLVTVIARHFLKPVPALVQATLRIAREETDVATPFQDRRDEIGDMATAIETLREAVLERGRLRQIRDMAQQMEHMAHHDALTGLPNRVLLMKTLENRLEHLSASGQLFNVMLLDLDRFKAVNDTLGHAAGDALLVAVASRISSVLGENDMVSRLGGDEFAIIQSTSGDFESDAVMLAARVVHAVSRSFALEGSDISIDTSIGIACAPGHGTSATQLLQHADLGLYRAKSMGCGYFVFYEPGMDMAAQHKHALEIDMKSALENHEFELHYQPVVNLQSGRIVAYEALARWRHSKLGLISPDRFIALAEENNFIRPLGEWVLAQACMDAMTWPKDIRLAVNLSAVQLCNDDIVPIVDRALEASGFPAERLELEVTETAMLERDSSTRVLKMLKERGVRLALDDFGTGYAGLSTLTHVAFDKIKIDREFVSGLPTNPMCSAIVNTVIDMAEQIGLKVTAEGVENMEQVEVLKLSGCDEAQGYYFAEPAPLAQLLKNRAVIVQVGKTEIADRAAQTGHDAGRPTQDTYCPSQKAI
ncbi:EAL domain-containing protein [Agrobacterium pusense]|uniref:EAL domain-containing protein n=1 Tax=Agrobacterium pusense TaxID=648995 RepID=UPI0015732714|nr:EAL domain-containing protein [Agrobacterium pusense]